MKVRKIETDHLQVPFETFYGQIVGVDEGLVNFLNCLKKLGCRTQFSCQGGESSHKQRGYVVMPYKDGRKLEKKIRDGIQAGLYSPETVEAFAKFKNCEHHIDLVKFRNPKARFDFRCQFRTLNRSAYSIEQQISDKQGHRRIYRWHYKDTPVLHAALEEVLAK